MSVRLFQVSSSLPESTFPTTLNLHPHFLFFLTFFKDCKHTVKKRHNISRNWLFLLYAKFVHCWLTSCPNPLLFADQGNGIKAHYWQLDMPTELLFLFGHTVQKTILWLLCLLTQAQTPLRLFHHQFTVAEHAKFDSLWQKLKWTKCYAVEYSADKNNINCVSGNFPHFTEVNI